MSKKVTAELGAEIAESACNDDGAAHGRSVVFGRKKHGIGSLSVCSHSTYSPVRRSIPELS
jgi:hypothetical protein